MNGQDSHQVSDDTDQDDQATMQSGNPALIADAGVSQDDNAAAPSSDGIALPAIRMPVPEDASDADLIEKEWVLKAKDIVSHTQSNPHEQQQALSKFKADYMKKRYNKDIKTEGA